MVNKIPKISVGMPVYNGEPYLEKSIQATLAQTYEDFELIISDNASTDKTPEICQDYAGRDKRITYIRNKRNIGAANNYNQLFREAKGIYFRWFNADDLCSEALHEKCLAILDSRPDTVLSYGKTDIIDSEGKLIQHYDDRLDLQQESVVDRFKTFSQVVGLTNAIYGLMRRSALEQTILMGDAKFPAADTNLMGELVLQGKIVEIPETLFFRRMHEDASSWDRSNLNKQQTFWKGTGANSKFVMPTFKKDFAYFKAINKAPITSSEKWQLRTFIMRKMIWSRDKIIRDIWQVIRGS
jgi:glycosyltransferase involved in cell wall biosynthesis